MGRRPKLLGNGGSSLELKRNFRKRFVLRIRHKIILSAYAAFLPVLIIIGGLAYSYNYSAVMSERTEQYQRAIVGINENIGYIEQDMLDIATYLSINGEIELLLMSNPEETAKDPLFWAHKTPISVIKDILAVKTKIAAVVLYPENGMTPFIVSRDRSVYVQDISDLRSLDIYRQAVEARGAMVWTRVNARETGLFINNISDKIVLCREIFDLGKRVRLGFLAISVNVGGYENICRNAALYDNESVLILDANRDSVLNYGEVPPEIESKLRTEGLPDRDLAKIDGYYVFTYRREFSNLDIYYLSPRKNWDAWIMNGLFPTALIGLALLIGIWPLSAVSSHYVSRPVMRLYESMNAFKNGNFTEQVHFSGRDEISELAETFNIMVCEIREQIDKNYVMALREKESELNALQAQINPHFLYNALGSIYWQAMSEGQDDLAENILSLSELFRILLSSGQSEVTVEQEMSIVRHYLRIQKMRFMKKLDYSIVVAPEALQRPILKLIIQPFVENAIVHGMEKSGETGFVKVEGCLIEGALHFTIEDNGVGMTQERVEEITRALNGDGYYASQRVGHYAISNVKERMLLRYGGYASLDITSAPGEGTVVRITIPAEMPKQIAI